MKQIYCLLFLVLLSLGCLDTSEVEKYFKRVTDRSEMRTIRNVDFIYMINLDQRPEKYNQCLEQLLPYGIKPYRFSAVNGWELSLEALNDIGIKYEPWMRENLWGTSYLPIDNGVPRHEVMQTHGQTYFCHCMARGTIGIVLSHLSVLQDAYDTGYNTVWIMEDDIQVIQNPHNISYLIEKLDRRVGHDEWDLLFTDQDTKDKQGNYVQCLSYALRPNFTPSHPKRFAKRRVIDKNFRKIGARYGAYSFIIRRSGMKKILDFIKHYGVFLPYDMEFYLPDDIKMYAVMDDVVSTQPDALSDNGSPNYSLKDSLQK